MPEPITLTTLVLAGAVAMGTETVKEVTKDAYKELKSKVGELFGPRAAKAADKLATDATREEGRAELDRYIPETLEPDETTQLRPYVDVLVAALRDDPVAREAVHSKMALDLDVGGAALLKNIEGVREMAVRAKTGGDFTMDGVKMDPGGRPGN